MTNGTSWLAKHKKAQGYTLEQYEAEVRSLNHDADMVMSEIIKRHGKCTGMYYRSKELGLNDSIEHDFIRICLKDRGIEFIENGTMFRV
jgi:hypothetical protein